jgi:hypothetical protein
MKTKNKKTKILKIIFLFAFIGIFFGVSLIPMLKNNIVHAQLLGDDGNGEGLEGARNLEDQSGVSAEQLKTINNPSPVSVPVTVTKRLDYTLLESFPGFFKAGSVMTDLPAMVMAIYKFGIWTIGIAGLFMLTIGGFMYMTSAGNNSTAGNAKGIIIDALWGIVAAMGAYLFLYVINPDLTRIEINFARVNVEETEGTPMGTKGVCQPVSSVSNLTSTFGSLATQASSICNGESNGKSVPSSVDKCADNSIASWGLFQINITAHSVGGYDCKKAFSSVYTAKDHSCRVIDQTLYNNCVDAAKNATNNIAAAKTIYTKAKSWKPWGANKASGCNFP